MAELAKKIKFITWYTDCIAVNVNAAYKDLILSAKAKLIFFLFFSKEYPFIQLISNEQEATQGQFLSGMQLV